MRGEGRKKTIAYKTKISLKKSSIVDNNKQK